MNLRKALISDEESVLAFCKNTFFWGDYIDQVWNSWISEGDLYVIDDNGYPVALCHATTFDDVTQDPNLPSYVRTSLWQAVSTLESIRE